MQQVSPALELALAPRTAADPAPRERHPSDLIEFYNPDIIPSEYGERGTITFTRIAFVGVLNRQPAGGEAASWDAQLTESYNNDNGIGVFDPFMPTLRGRAHSLLGTLFNSLEYVGAPPADEQYVIDLYEAYLDRPGDPEGVAFWTGELAGGMTRAALRELFGGSPEFERRVLTVTPATKAGFDPRLAVARFAGIEGLYWRGFYYPREVVERGEVNRHMDEEISDCSITFSNIDKSVAAFFLSRFAEGMHVVVRTIDRTVQGDSVVIFTGRARRPEEVDKTTCRVTVAQEFGSTEHEIPPREMRPECPLEFKGFECMGNQSLDQKTLAYRNADFCDKSWGRCAEYGNTDFNQSFRFVPQSGYWVNWVEVVKRRFFFFKKRTRTPDRVQWSSEDVTPYGTVVPMVLGRVQAELIPIVQADVGTAVKWLQLASEGRIEGITNIQSRTPGFPVHTVSDIHLGDWGGTGTNATPSPMFPELGVFSRTAYIGGWNSVQVQSDIDSAALLTATVAGMRVPLPDQNGVFNLEGFSDDPTLLTRFALTDPRCLGIHPGLVNDLWTRLTSAKCRQPIRDDSNGELLFMLPEPRQRVVSGEERRFRSTGILNPRFFNTEYGWGNAVDPWYFEDIPNPNEWDYDAPPAQAAPVRFLRRRYTANTILTDKQKALDFLFNVLLPSFRGFLVWGADGRIQIKTEEPADSAYLYTAAALGAASIPVSDVLPWRADRRGHALIDVGSVNSEVLKVANAQYRASAVAFAPSATGAMTLTQTGGGVSDDDGQPDFAVFTVGGAPQYGAQVIATVDGTAVAYTLNSEDTIQSAAAMLAAHVNADETLNKYVRALWDAADPTRVRLESKRGAVLFQPGVVTGRAHDAGVEVIRVMHVFTKENIRPNSFKWPQPSDDSVNQVKITYRSAKDDFAEREIRLNDYEHQRQTGKTNTLEIEGDAVDNYHQAYRLANAALAKAREGDFTFSWLGGMDALLLEEGDVVCCSDASGDWVNVPVRVETLTISPRWDVGIGGRLYSTVMYSDEVGQHSIELPTQLAYVQSAPPPASNLQLSEVGAMDYGGVWRSRLRVQFDFGTYLGEQRARVLVQRPADPQYKQFAIVTPDANNQGVLDVPDAAAGPHSVQVITESSRRQSASAGHPVASWNITGLPTAVTPPSGLGLTFDGAQITGAFLPSPDDDILEYIYTDGAGAELQRGKILAFTERPNAPGTYHRRVYARNRRRVVSTLYASASVVVPAPGNPTVASATQAGGYVMNGTWQATVTVTINFPAYAYGQQARVYVTEPGGSEYDTGRVLVPSGSNQASFDLTARAKGNHTFRFVLSQTPLGFPGGQVSTTVNVVDQAVSIDTPTLFGYSFAGNVVVYTWRPPATNPERARAYEIWATTADLGNLNNRLYRGAALTFAEAFAQVTSNPTRYLRAVDDMGNASAFVSITPDLSTTPAPSNFGLSYNHVAISGAWTPPAPASAYAYFEVAADAAFTQIVYRGRDTSYAETPAAAGVYTRYLRAVSVLERPSAAVSAQVTVNAPAAPSSVTATYNDSTNALMWRAVAASPPPNAMYEWSADQVTILRRTASPEWDEESTYGQATYTRYVRVVAPSGLKSTWAGAAVTLPTPDPASLLTGAYDEASNLLQWRATVMAPPRRATYEWAAAPTDTPTAYLRITSSPQWDEPPAYGTQGYTRYVRVVAQYGIKSAWALVSGGVFNIPAPAALTAGALALYHPQLFTSWGAQQNRDYEVWRSTDTSNPANRVWRGSSSYASEAGFPTASRSVTRHVRAVNYAGIPGPFLAVSNTFPAPAAPSVAKDTSPQPPTSLRVHVAAPANEHAVRGTVIQTRAAGGSWPSSVADGTDNQIRVPGAPREFVIPWSAGGAMEYRVAHEDIFTPTLNDQVWSATGSHTFPVFNEGSLDPNSTFFKKGGWRNAIIKGGGTITWTAAFAVRWDAAVEISVPLALSPTGLITIAANPGGVALAAGQMLVAVHAVGSTSATTQVITLASAAWPAETSTTSWIPLFERRADNSLATFYGQPLQPDRMMDSRVLIPMLTSFDADFFTLKVTKANIRDVYAGTVVSDVNDARIVFAQQMGSRIFTPSGAQTATTEAAVLERAGGTGQVTAGGALYITGAGLGFAYASRAAFYGDASATFSADENSQRDYTFHNPATGVYYGYRFDPSVFSRGVYKLVGGAATNVGTWAPGDAFELRKVGGVITLYRNGAAFHSMTDGGDFSPALVRVAGSTAGSLIPPPTISGFLAPALGEKVRWGTLVGMALDPSDSPYKTAASGWGAASGGAFSADSLAAGQDGGVEFVAPAAGQNLMAGLSPADADADYTSIHYAAHCNGAGQLNVYESGNLRFSQGYAAGDVLRVAREGGVVRYRRNGALVYSSAVPSGGAALYADVAVFTQGGVVGSPRMFKVGAKPVGVMFDLPAGTGEIGDNLLIGGKRVDRVLVGAAEGMAADRRYRGADFGLFQPHKVTAARVADYRVLTDGSDRVDVNLDVTFPGKGSDDYANGDSVQFARVRVIDCFGAEVLPATDLQFNATGRLPNLTHTLRYAHPTRQAVYAIRVWNKFLWSEEFYVSQQAKADAQPAPKRKADSPKELGVARRGGQLTFGWRQPNLNSGTYVPKLWCRWVGRDWHVLLSGSGGEHGFVIQQSGVSVTPTVPADTLLEFYVENSSIPGSTSNVVPVIIPTPDNAPAVSASWNIFAGDPLARVRLSVVNGNTPPTATNVIRFNPDGTTTALGAGVLLDDTAVVGSTYYYAAYHTFAGPSYSAFGNAVKVTIPAGANANDPMKLRITSQTSGRADFRWELGTSTGTVYLDWKVDDGNYASGWTTVTLPAGTTMYALTGLSQQTPYAVRVRVADAGTNPTDVLKFNGNGTHFADYE